MPVRIFVENAFEDLGFETYELAENTDIIYRRLRNKGYARRFAENVLNAEHTALDLAAVKIIKNLPVGIHPVQYINSRNLTVLRVVTLSNKRAVCLGKTGRVYSATRGPITEDGKFIPMAETLKLGFSMFSARKLKTRRGAVLTRKATLNPTLLYF